MTKSRKIAVAIFLGGVIFAPFFAAAYFAIPGSPTGFVNDFANVLSADQKTTLESKLASFNASTTIEIAIVTVQNLGGDTIETAARKIFDEWQIGKAKEDNGVLVLLAVEERMIRIEPGYGLEGALTDIQSRAIIDGDIAPAFKEGRYYDGFDAGVESIISAIRGEAKQPIEGQVGSVLDFIAGLGWFFPLILFGIFRVLAIILGRTKSWWLGGVLGGAFGVALGFFLASLVIGTVATILLAIFGLILDFAFSKSYDSWKSGGGKGPWLGGGFGGGKGFGGGGFGGFGGGRSGGGGASGGF